MRSWLFMVVHGSVLRSILLFIDSPIFLTSPILLHPSPLAVSPKSSLSCPCLMLLFLLPLVPYRVLIMLSDLEVHGIVYLIFSVTAESTYLTSSDTFPPISLLFPSSSPLLPPLSSCYLFPLTGLTKFPCATPDVSLLSSSFLPRRSPKISTFATPTTRPDARFTRCRQSANPSCYPSPPLACIRLRDLVSEIPESAL